MRSSSAADRVCGYRPEPTPKLIVARAISSLTGDVGSPASVDDAPRPPNEAELRDVDVVVERARPARCRPRARVSMSAADVIVALVVVAALGFDFTNGFHDTANAMATTIATGALPPRVAVTIAAILNFVGAFISLKVATTIAAGIVEAGAITPTVVLGGLIGAICWNLTTWWFG